MKILVFDTETTQPNKWPHFMQLSSIYFDISQNRILNESTSRSEDDLQVLNISSSAENKNVKSVSNHLLQGLHAMVANISYTFFLLEFVIGKALGRRQVDLIIPRTALNDDIHYSVSFSPGGFNMAYTGGALKVIQKYRDVFKHSVFLGVSTGAVVASCICVGMQHDKMAGIMKEFNYGFAKLGPRGWHLLIGMLGTLLDRELPDDAHKLCDGRLVIGLTLVKCRFPSCLSTLFAVTAMTAAFLIDMCSNPYVLGRTTYYYYAAQTLGLVAFFIIFFGTVQKIPSYKSRFTSKAELITTLLCSCSIPMVQDRLPLRWDLQQCCCIIDGAFTMNHLVLETKAGDTKTITIECNVRHIPRPDVLPSVALPDRVVTPPSTTVLYELLDMGANDFLEHIAHLGLVVSTSQNDTLM